MKNPSFRDVVFAIAAGAALVTLLVMTAGCANFADQTKVWEAGCHVTVDGTMNAGLMGVSGQASIHKECWPDGAAPVPAAPPVL
jgi:hypothetical protein